MFDQNGDIAGIEINNTTFKMIQFADDTTIFLDGTCDSLTAALNTLEIFGSLSGLKVNTDKTKIVWLGKKKFSRDKIHTAQKLDWGTTEFNLLGLTFSVNLREIPALNYEPAMIRAKETINRWKRRCLSPIGKITVIKTFIIASFNHIFSTIPSLNHLTNQLDKLIYSFLWDDKPHKIGKKYITNDYAEGGLRMTHLENFITSQKLVWIKRMISYCDAPWVTLLSTKVNIEKLYTMGSQWSKNAANAVSNPFWKDTFLAWCSFLDKLPINEYNALHVPLWYNPLISAQPLFLPQWNKSGIHTPLDLLNSDNTIMSMPELVQKYNLQTNFLECLRIQRCVKSYVKQFNVEKVYHCRPIYPAYLKTLTKSIGSKSFYEILNKQNDNQKLKEKWSKELKSAINNIDWKGIYKICFKTLKRNDLIWLQYRIIQRILGTKSYLFKINKSMDNTCSFCRMPSETLVHLFTSCHPVTDFWNKLFQWLQQCTGLYVNLDPKIILLGHLEHDIDFFPKNILILVAKHYIWNYCKKAKPLSIGEFKIYFRQIYVDQKYIAQTNSQSDKFNASWSIFKDI